MNVEGDIAGKNDWTKLEPSYGIKVFLTILYSLILVTGILGNGITIKVSHILTRNGYLQKNVTNHMVSLACSDLLVLLIGMPVEVYISTWYPFSSTSGNASCKIYNFLFEACSYATILNVATLSFERYTAICHPFHFKGLTDRRTSGLIAFAWLTSVVVAMPLLFATGAQWAYSNGTIPTHNVTFCTNLRERRLMYQISVFGAFVVYLTVLICVAFMCWAMIRVLRRPLGATAGGLNGSEPKHENAKTKAARKQTIIFLALIVGALMICWLPYQVCRLMKAAKSKRRWTEAYFHSYITLHPVADTFFYLSSVLNPFLYNLSSRQFRQVFLQVLRCRLTIEHINKRTVRSSRVTSLQPMLLKSLRRSRAEPTPAQDHGLSGTSLRNTDSGLGSEAQRSLHLSEGSAEQP